jgi:hypothetical protein
VWGSIIFWRKTVGSNAVKHVYKYTKGMLAVSRCAAENAMETVYMRMKMTASWDIALCGLIEVDRHFRGSHCLHHQGDECDYMVLYPRRLSSWYCHDNLKSQMCEYFIITISEYYCNIHVHRTRYEKVHLYVKKTQTYHVLSCSLICLP